MLEEPPEGEHKVAVQFLGHSGFRIVSKERTIFIDPFFSEGGPGFIRKEQPFEALTKVDIADLVLVTHEHFDHCDVPTLKYLKEKTGAKIVTNPASDRKLPFNCVLMKPKQTLTLKDIKITAFPAEHSAENPLGFLIEIDSVRLYHAGDTENLPKDLKPVDILMVPCGGVYTMDPEKAKNEAVRVGAEIVIPMHFGTFDGLEKEPGFGKKLNVGEWLTYG